MISVLVLNNFQRLRKFFFLVSCRRPDAVAGEDQRALPGRGRGEHRRRVGRAPVAGGGRAGRHHGLPAAGQPSVCRGAAMWLDVAMAKEGIYQ